MLLIIAHHNDVEAQWLYDILHTQHTMRITLLHPEALGIDYSITLHLANNGQHKPSIQFFETGHHLNGSDISYAINRLSYIDPIVWQHAAQEEKNYATNELNAFFPAFLHALPCPLSNPIHNGSLYGGRDFVWHLASCLRRQGIETHPLTLDAPDKLFTALNAAPPAQLWRLMHLGRTIITPYDQEPSALQDKIEDCLLHHEPSETMELVFLKEKDHFLFFNASKAPSLSLYGDQLIETITQKMLPHDTTDRYTQRAARAPAY